jgi:hypothetical protein
MGSLTALWNIGNKTRKSPANLTNFLQSESTKEFIAASEKEWGMTGMVAVTGRGNQKQTMAHVCVMIYAAEYLSPAFHAHVIKTFCEDRILQWRDSSGDEFKAMNIVIDHYLPGREGRDNKGIFIQTAVLIREKINPDGGGWNTATAEQLQRRDRLQNDITKFLKMGFIKDWNHLKETISKL